MRKFTAGQGHIRDLGMSNQAEELDLASSSEGSGGNAAEPVDGRSRMQPKRTNSIGARLVGLVAGTSKGK